MVILISRGTRLGREAMASALREHGFEVVAASDNLATPHASIEVVLIFSGTHPSGVVAEIQKYRLLYPKAMIVLVGADNPDHEILFFIEAGAHAYTPSSASLDDLVHTIKAVKRGESACSGRLGALVATKIAALIPSQHLPEQADLLTVREQQILRLVAAGLSNLDIALQLSISLHTVKIHVHRILEKLHLRRRQEAARWIHSQAQNSSAVPERELSAGHLS